jgi:hypothetical protein
MNTKIDEAIAEVTKLAAIPRKTEVRQLYGDGDLTRIGDLTSDAIMEIPRRLADELHAMATVMEETAKLLREDAERLIVDFQARAQHYSEEIKTTTAAAKTLQDTIRATRAQMMRRIESAPAVVAG